MSFADKIICFNQEIAFSGRLPKGIRIMNPFRDNNEISEVSALFYKRFYEDEFPRRLILGINPGRLGAGATGIPFTDTKRLETICGIRINSFNSHEPSSVFIYDMIARYGGAEKFYRDYFISSVCPLGFIRKNERGTWVNCNYYDQKDLIKAVWQFIISSLNQIIKTGINTDICYVLGKKNASYVDLINQERRFFKKIVVLEHPRYIEQYKSKEREKYIQSYVEQLKT